MKTFVKFIGIFGVFTLLLMQWLEIRDSQTWATVVGEITSAHIVGSLTGGKSPPRSRYQVELQYRYLVSGVSYSGDRLAIQPKYHSSQAHAESELAAYPVGRQVAIYYNPSKPEKSVLVR
jgi:hypothetical protein